MFEVALASVAVDKRNRGRVGRDVGGEEQSLLTCPECLVEKSIGEIDHGCARLYRIVKLGGEVGEAGLLFGKREGSRLIGRISQEMRGARKRCAFVSGRKAAFPPLARPFVQTQGGCAAGRANVRFVLLARIAASGYVSQLFVCGSD